MRRSFLLAGMWTLGVVVAVALAFAAVGRVANGVAPRDSARLSQSAIDNALSASSTSPATPTTRRKPPPKGSTSTTGSSSTPTTGSTAPTISESTTRPTSVTEGTSAWSPPPTTTPTTASSPPPTVAPQNTATPSQGGTIFTRCSGPNAITYVAAVPHSGYERTVDVESPAGIRQTFQSATHVSRIEAECSDGTVHAQVEEESTE